jgi:predicted nucleic acid-binding protein
MNGNRYLADTNAFIYLLQKHPALKSLLQAEWMYCFITEIELLGKPGINLQKQSL